MRKRETLRRERLILCANAKHRWSCKDLRNIDHINHRMEHI